MEFPQTFNWDVYLTFEVTTQGQYEEVLDILRNSKFRYEVREAIVEVIRKQINCETITRHFSGVDVEERSALSL